MCNRPKPCNSTGSFTQKTQSDVKIGHAQQFRPMCPTRWLVRVSEIQAILNQYEQVQERLDEMSPPSSGTNVSVLASDLHTKLSKAEI